MRNSLRKCAVALLFALGLFEIVFGMVLAPLQIYAVEPALAETLGISALSSEQKRSYHDTMKGLQRWWVVVTGCGLLTTMATVVLHRSETSQAKDP